MVLSGSGELVGLLAHRVVSVSDEGIVIAGRVSIADLGAARICVAKALLRVDFKQLSRLRILVEKLGVGSLGFFPRRVLPELRSRRHLGALGLIETVLEDIRAPAGGV